ncbi:thaumatin-like protein 1a [Quercus suber]|uniref:Thaumatin-like protein 1a n=1 Tax=Quercus suber TaxID=58331 RepID=A0AAW0L6X4_QUESU
MVYGSPTSFCYLQERFCFHVLDGDKEYDLYMLHAGAHSARITFTNNCLNTVWPGTLTADQQPQLLNTGFELSSKAFKSVDAPPLWKDGFNLPISVATQGGSGDCRASSCPTNVTMACPTELQMKGSDGRVLACKSACTAFNKPNYCCTGTFNTPQTCPPTDYSRLFKQQCRQAYSYAYDDPDSTFTCSGRPDYLITFCP